MPPPPTNGSHRLKSKTGCFTCRARRKKCDEERPTCIGCRRNYLICTWPSLATQDIVSEKSPGKMQYTAPHRVPVRLSRGEGCGNGVGSGSNAAAQRFVAANKKQLRHLLPFPSTFNLHPIFSTSIPGLRKEREKRIFDHYVKATATEITGRILPHNPFVSYFLPVAYQDTRVVTCLLALSGAHLCMSKDNRFEVDARSYYAVTLRSVKHWLVNWKQSSTQEVISLLIVMLVLAWFENLIGEMHGNVYHHLRASRTVLLELRARHMQGPLMDLLTEVYAFLTISTNITIGTDFPVSRYIPYDDFLLPEALSSLNQGTEMHGILMGSSHELEGLIIPITESARHHMREQDPVRKAKDKQDFERRIRAWKYVPSPSTTDDVSERVAAEIQQQVLLIFLHTMFHSADRPSISLMETADGILDNILELTLILSMASQIHTTMTWPARVAGSVCRKQKHRKMMLGHMNILHENRPRAVVTSSFLENLWEEMDKDDMIYGPRGIEIIMRRKGINLCCL